MQIPGGVIMPDNSRIAALEKRVSALEAMVKKFTSANTCVMPLPKLDECIYMAVSANSGEDAFRHDCEIVKKVYEFIGRQQHQ